MEQRAEGKSRLVYDKVNRTIVSVASDLTMCAGCNEAVSKTWAYCPWCGAQERVEDCQS